jgi:hypothetical protein
MEVGESSAALKFLGLREDQNGKVANSVVLVFCTRKAGSRSRPEEEKATKE